jgi:hypothetical protein
MGFSLVDELVVVVLKGNAFAVKALFDAATQFCELGLVGDGVRS